MNTSVKNSSIKHISSAKLKNIRRHLIQLYGVDQVDGLLERLYLMIGRYGVGIDQRRKDTELTQRDTMLITYADMVHEEGTSPLSSLREFCTARLKGAFSTIHILPFYPWTSDDGFSVVDYREVDSRYGSWEDVGKLAEDFDLMFDLVLNHCSSKSPWFKDWVSGVEPGRNYILEGDETEDLSAVVRPRASPLLTPYQTRGGERFVWTTFSADQVDLDWKSPDLLFEFLDIILYYISIGCRILRLDAVAFLWKKIGTNCLHLPETHQVIKLIRNFLEVVAPEVVILTETNVPHEENVSYFGKGDEAHAVYQFSLPPLLLHGLLRGTAQHLTNWAQNLSEPPKGCYFLNFTASHDGIGVRPLEGILPQGEILALADEIRGQGGLVSMRKLADGKESPYELNCTYVSALAHPEDDSLGMERFRCSQAIALSLKGIPAVYFHSLCGTQNFEEGVQKTGQNRTINRRKWKRDELEDLLDRKEGRYSEVFAWYTRTLRCRSSCPAFHPDASQVVHDLGPSVFALERKSMDGTMTVFCLYNFTDGEYAIDNMAVINEALQGGKARDLLGGGEVFWGDACLTLRPYQALWLSSN